MQEINSQNNLTEKETKKSLSKKAKIAIIISSIVAVLLIVGAVLLIVLLPRDGEADDYNMPARKMQYEYYIDYEDRVGFYISDNFRCDVPISQFTLTEIFGSEGISLSQDLSLKATENAEVGMESVYHFSFRNKVIAIVNVKVVDVDAYITTKEELLNATEDKVYVVKNPINLQGDGLRISRVIGKLHFNHNEISGYNAESGGLFAELDGATITGLDMIDLTGTFTYVNAGNVGVIADYANNSKIRYSSVKGSLNLTSTAPSTDVLYVGSMVGYANAIKRKNYSTEEVGYVQLVSYLELNVKGSGDLRIGGVIGGVRNASLEGIYSYGKINVTVDETAVGSLANLYLGGIVGALSKQYDTIQSSYVLDEGNQLYSYADLKLSVNGGGEHNSINVGGVFGYLQNHSLINNIFGGKIDISLTRAHLNVGGIVGATDNTTNLKMSISAIEIKGEIKVYSLASVNAGGIIGESVETQYSQVVSSITPTITTDKSKVQGTQIAESAIGKVKQ